MVVDAKVVDALALPLVTAVPFTEMVSAVCACVLYSVIIVSVHSEIIFTSVIGLVG